MKEDSLGSFFVQLGILLPSFFFAWYMTAPLLAQVLASLLDPILFFLWPGNVLSVTPADSKIAILLRFPAGGPLPDVLASGLRTTDKGVLVNSLTYSYGLPLFLALCLASSASLRQHLVRLALGTILVGCGVCFAIVASLVFALDSDPALGSFHILEDPLADAFAIKYLHFVGFSLVPRIIPVLAWALLYREGVRILLAPLLRGLSRQGPK